MQFFNPPFFEDEERDRKAKINYYIILSIFIGFFIFVIERLVKNETGSITLFIFVLILLFFTYLLVLKGYIDTSSKLVVIILQGFTFYRAFTHNGIHDTILYAIPGIIVVSGLLLSKKGYLLSVVWTISFISLLGYLEINGLVKTFNKYETTFNHIFDRILITIVTAIGVNLYLQVTEKNLKKIKQSEEELRKTTSLLKTSEERFRLLYEKSSFPILLLNDDIKIIDCNSAAIKLFKFESEEELIGKNLADISPEYQENRKKSNEYVLENKEHVDKYGSKIFEWLHYKKNNEIFVCEITMTKIDFSGKIVYLCHLRDITERKQYENEIKEKQLFIEKVTEQTPDVIYINDTTNNKTIYANRNLLTILGYDIKAINDLNKFYGKILHPDDEYQFLDYFNRRFNDDDSTIYNYQYRMKDAKGNWRWFIAKEKVFQRENGKVISIIGTLREITTLKQTEEGLERERLFNETILHSVPGIFYVYDKNGYLKTWNNNHETLTGYTAEELKDKHMSTWFDEDDRDKVLKETAKTFEEGKAEVEAKLILKSGEKIPYYFTGVKMISNGEEYLVGYGLDISERIANAEALKKSEELYRTLMDNMNEAVIQVDNDDKIIYVNRSFEKLFGYKFEEIVGKIGYELLADEKEKGKIIESNKNRQKGISEKYEIKFKSYDGKYMDILVSAAPVKDSKGEVIGSIGVMTDITERKKTLEKLKESEEKFRLLAENASDIIMVQNLDGEFTYVSPSCKSILGYEPEELLGKSMSFFITNEVENISTNKDNIEKNTYTFIYTAKTKEGKEIWLEATINIINDEHGLPREFHLIARDITQRKNLENEMIEMMNFVNHIIDSLPVGLISINREKEVTLYNLAATKFLNENLEPNNKNLFEMFPILKKNCEPLSNAIQNRVLFEQVITDVDEEGELKHIKYIITPIHRFNRTGCIILIEDITKARNIEQLMIQSEKMISVAGLAAGMAHEINNPLGTIVQGCQNILRRVSPELQKNIDEAEALGIDINLISKYFENRKIFEIIESMRNASARASEIIKNMLQFSRRSESKMVLFDVNTLLEQTLELANNDYDFKKKYDFRSIKIVKEIDENLPEVKLTVTEIQQVLFNLLRNAVQAMRDENNNEKTPTIYLRAKKEEKYLRIEVEDNGPGIPDKYKNRIFEPFFTTKEIGEGTGLGLSVSYMIVTNNHKGLMEFESKINKGTKFIIKLPL